MLSRESRRSDGSRRSEPFRRRSFLTAVAVTITAGAVGLVFSVVFSTGQPLPLALLLAGVAAVDYAVLAGRDARRQREADAQQRLREALVAPVSNEMRSPLPPFVAGPRPSSSVVTASTTPSGAKGSRAS